jgi:hypothetical protein
MNALSDFDFALLPRAGKLDAGAKRPSGHIVPFYRIEGRIAIKAQMGHENLTLILDSGATHMVLFRTPEAMANSPALPLTSVTAVYHCEQNARSHDPPRRDDSSGLRRDRLRAAAPEGELFETR